MNRINITAGGVNVRRAFTLVELIVVIGIIGILAGIIITSFNGGMEAARSAKCLSNMRNLAQGATTYAVNREAGGSSDYLPYAGSFVAFGNVASRMGWISWFDMGCDDKGVPYDNINACCKDEIKATYAITNGALWKYVNRDMKTYVCPEHEARAVKHNAKPRFSYVMNAQFLFDNSMGRVGEGRNAWDAGVSWTMNVDSAERLLIFAELPFGVAGSSYDKANARFCPYTTDKKKQRDGEKKLFAQMDGQGNTLFDCVLQYKARYNGRGYHDGDSEDWGGEPEAIAFNHRNGKKWCAHVVFADGHTEKLTLVEEGKSSTLDAYQLTALLCEGVAVGYDGSDGYFMPAGADKVLGQ